jgi:hypothetical protein
MNRTREQRVEQLRQAARDRSDRTLARANAAIDALRKNGDTITFRAVARRGGVYLDFLYSNPQLRDRIAALRAKTRTEPARPVEPSPESTIVLALTNQLRQAREEITKLQAALAAAHGENLELRREQNQPRYRPAT